MISTLIISTLATTYLIAFVFSPVYGIAFITAFRTLFLLFQVRIGSYAYSGDGFLTLMIILTGFFYILLNRNTGFPKAIVTPFVLFIFYCTLTFGFTDDTANFLKKDLRMIGYLVLYLVVFALSRKSENVTIFSWAFLIAIFITTLPAVYVLYKDTDQYLSLDTKPALGGFMKKNNFGFFSCYMIYFLFYIIGTLKKQAIKVVAIGLTLVQFAVFIFSFTRSAWVGFTGALPFFLVFSKNKAKFLLPFAFLAALGGLLFPVIYFGLVTDISEKREYGMSSLQWRLEYAWPASIKAFRERPITGWGLGNNLHAMTTAARLRKTSHNDYLLILVETGIIGLMLYVWLIGALWIKTFRDTLSADDHKKPLLVAALAMFTAFLIGSLAEHLLQTPGATGYVITFLAMAHGQSTNMGKQRI